MMALFICCSYLGCLDYAARLHRLGRGVVPLIVYTTALPQDMQCSEFERPTAHQTWLKHLRPEHTVGWLDLRPDRNRCWP
jgi:hypothetical protein